MPPFRRWADLPPDLLCRIGDGLDLQSYAGARGGCTAWRCALALPSPSLLVALDYDRRCLSAASLSTHRSFELQPILPGARCVGASNGWLALSLPLSRGGGHGIFSLFNPVTGAEIILPPLVYQTGWVSKIVFVPSPAADDFAAAAICDMDRLAYVTAGARRWAILDPVRLARGDRLADLVYDEKGKVYCITHYGDIHLLCLPERRRRKPIVVQDPAPAGPSSGQPVIHVLRWCPAARAAQTSWIHRQPRLGPPTTVEPDLNAPATLKPLLSLPFDPATSFSPPYDTIAPFACGKSLVFCEGNMYQVWRNASCTVTLQLPGGGRRRVAENEIFVLRYYPRRQPCWDAVTDLGGCSVFVGRNNAVSMYAQGVMGLKGNCVYWIGGRDNRDHGMVFDMATGRSTPCLCQDETSAICWYFLSDMVSNRNNNNAAIRVYA